LDTTVVLYKTKLDFWPVPPPATNLTGLLKNAHLRRYPAASPSWRRGKKSLLIRRDAAPLPSPCQARGRFVAAYYFTYAAFVSFWASGFRGPCIWAFWGSPRKIPFSCYLLMNRIEAQGLLSDAARVVSLMSELGQISSTIVIPAPPFIASPRPNFLTP
jgi:hypothetical protein